MHLTLPPESNNGGLNLPEGESFISFLEMSSATKEVATLRRGILNNFDILLKIVMETPAEPSSTGPTKARDKHKYTECPENLLQIPYTWT